MHERKRLIAAAFIATAFLALVVSPAFGVVSTVDLNVTTATNLAQTLVPGAAVGSVNYTGDPNAGGTFSGGDVLNGIGIASGVTMSSGDIATAEIVPNDNSTGNSSNVNGQPGDPDLEPIIALVQTLDASVLTFEFTPGLTQNVIEVPLVFASEEYTESVFAVNDGVAVWVNGVNVALVPGTTDPIAISTVNPVVNPAFFNNNDPFEFGGTPPFGTLVQYDGFTDVVMMRVSVVPGGVNDVKIAIADEDDAFVDSAVFLGPGVFSDIGPDILTVVTQYYNDILNRAPEPGGAEFWRDEILRIVSLGIDIKEGFIALGNTFFNSAEYIALGTTDTQYVTDLYNAFLGRTPDPAGLAFWEGQLTAGLGRNAILNFFVFSEEFDTTLQGVFALAGTRPENDLLNDSYRGILARLPDSVGFNFWLAQLQTAQCSGVAQNVRNLAYQVALGFIQSGEYAARARTDVEYVEDLYNAIMRRSPSVAEFNTWVAVLGGGTPRADVLQSFVNAPEFQTRVQEVINTGCRP